MTALPSIRIDKLGLLFFLLSTALFSSQALAVDCSSPDITLTSQVDVDNFQSTYGGGGICDSVTGNLRVGDGQNDNDIIDLNGLANLTSVGASLFLNSNTVLTNVDGLINLSSIGGALNIVGNRLLSNLNGLSGITDIPVNLSILNNGDGLTHIDGLAGITNVGGDIFINNNTALTNVDGLASVANVGITLSISNNDAMVNINGLGNLTSVGGNFTITGNDRLSNINGFSALQSVGASVTLSSNPLLAICRGLIVLLNDVDDGPVGPGPGSAGIPDVGGNVTIASNLPGCNSIEDVLQSALSFLINAGLNGAWFNAATLGQGFFLEVFPDIPLVFLAWFTYDTTQTQTLEVAATENPLAKIFAAQVGDENHRWLTAQGAFVGDTATLNVNLTQGGLFDDPQPTTNTPEGTITLTFQDCSSGTVDYEFTAADVSGSVPISRLANDNVALCQALGGE